MQLFIGKHAADTLLKSRSPCYGAWLSFDHRSELASPIVFSATATEHGCELIAWIDYEVGRNLAATKIEYTNTVTTVARPAAILTCFFFLV